MTPIRKELLSILVCPENHQPLELAEAALVDRLNRAIAAGKIRNVGGEKVEQPIESGLVRQDHKVLYIIQDAIPVMLVDEAIPLGQLGSED